MTVTAFLIGVVIGALLYRYTNRPTGIDIADELCDVTPIIAPDEPWPGYTPGGPGLVHQRRRHWQVGTEAYDIQNVIRRAWHEH